MFRLIKNTCLNSKLRINTRKIIRNLTDESASTVINASTSINSPSTSTAITTTEIISAKIDEKPALTEAEINLKHERKMKFFQNLRAYSDLVLESIPARNSFKTTSFYYSNYYKANNTFDDINLAFSKLKTQPVYVNILDYLSEHLDDLSIREKLMALRIFTMYLFVRPSKLETKLIQQIEWCFYENYKSCDLVDVMNFYHAINAHNSIPTKLNLKFYALTTNFVHKNIITLLQSEKKLTGLKRANTPHLLDLHKHLDDEPLFESNLLLASYLTSLYEKYLTADAHKDIFDIVFQRNSAEVADLRIDFFVYMLSEKLMSRIKKLSLPDRFFKKYIEIIYSRMDEIIKLHDQEPTFLTYKLENIFRLFPSRVNEQNIDVYNKKLASHLNQTISQLETTEDKSVEYQLRKIILSLVLLSSTRKKPSRTNEKESVEQLNDYYNYLFNINILNKEETKPTKVKFSQKTLDKIILKIDSIKNDLNLLEFHVLYQNLIKCLETLKDEVKLSQKLIDLLIYVNRGFVQKFKNNHRVNDIGYYLCAYLSTHGTEEQMEHLMQNIDSSMVGYKIDSFYASNRTNSGLFHFFFNTDKMDENNFAECGVFLDFLADSSVGVNKSTLFDFKPVLLALKLKHDFYANNFSEQIKQLLLKMNKKLFAMVQDVHFPVEACGEILHDILGLLNWHNKKYGLEFCDQFDLTQMKENLNLINRNKVENIRLNELAALVRRVEYLAKLINMYNQSYDEKLIYDFIGIAYKLLLHMDYMRKHRLEIFKDHASYFNSLMEKLLSSTMSIFQFYAYGHMLNNEKFPMYQTITNKFLRFEPLEARKSKLTTKYVDFFYSLMLTNKLSNEYAIRLNQAIFNDKENIFQINYDFTDNSSLESLKFKKLFYLNQSICINDKYKIWLFDLILPEVSTKNDPLKEMFGDNLILKPSYTYNLRANYGLVIDSKFNITNPNKKIDIYKFKVPILIFDNTHFYQNIHKLRPPFSTYVENFRKCYPVVVLDTTKLKDIYSVGELGEYIYNEILVAFTQYLEQNNNKTIKEMTKSDW